MIIIVCSGRDLEDVERVFRVLDDHNHFPGGKGTAGMVAAAKAAGLKCVAG